MTPGHDPRILRIAGPALVLRGDDIDTDRIMPARFLRAVTFDGLETHVFEDDRAAVTRRGLVHPLDTPAGQRASVLIVNRNFGCGSSREHAPQGLARRGIQAIVGESFAEIFFSNATALGMPCVTARPEAVTAIMAVVEQTSGTVEQAPGAVEQTSGTVEQAPGAVVEIDLSTLRATVGADSWPIHVPAFAREAFVAGTWDATALLTAQFDDVLAVAARLPYVRGF